MEQKLTIMKSLRILWIYLLIYTFAFVSCAQSTKKPTEMKLNELSSEEEYVILNKGTERPFTGKYNDFKGKGIFTCRQCNKGLFLSEYKKPFHHD